uniref:Putative DNA binding protein n=2 Tax=viral metagenome TaxID=1070528 RepID=A0A6M3J0E1_9ZZZZ
MIILDIAKYLKKHGYGNVPKPDLAIIIRDTFAAVSALAVEKNEGFALQIPRFGTFRIVRYEKRIGHNPKTREKINIPAKLKFKLKTSHILTDSLPAPIEGRKVETKKKKKEEKKVSKKKK